MGLDNKTPVWNYYFKFGRQEMVLINIIEEKVKNLIEFCSLKFILPKNSKELKTAYGYTLLALF